MKCRPPSARTTTHEEPRSAACTAGRWVLHEPPEGVPTVPTKNAFDHRKCPGDGSQSRNCPRTEASTGRPGGYAWECVEQRRPLSSMATHSTAIRRFECDARNVGVVRAFVARTVKSWGWSDPDANDAVLAASEMATNAVLHARSAFEVRLHFNQTGLRIKVADRDPEPPVAAHPATAATSGRGLFIVSAVGASWGVVRRPGGKVV